MFKKLLVSTLVALMFTASAQFNFVTVYATDNTGKDVGLYQTKVTTIKSAHVYIGTAIFFQGGTGQYQNDTLIKFKAEAHGKVLIDTKIPVDNIARAGFTTNDKTKPWYIDYVNMSKAVINAQGLPYLIKADLSNYGLEKGDTLKLSVNSGVYSLIWNADVTTGINDVGELNAPVLVSSFLIWGTSDVYVETYSDGSRSKVIRR